MSGEFDVFDEWGSYVGKFTPAGGGFGDTIIMLIAMLVLWTIGFLIFLFIKLIVNGLKAAKKGEWDKATAYFAPFIVVLLFLVLQWIGAAASATNPESACNNFGWYRSGYGTAVGLKNMNRFEVTVALEVSGYEYGKDGQIQTRKFFVDLEPQGHFFSGTAQYTGLQIENAVIVGITTHFGQKSYSADCHVRIPFNESQ